MRNDIVIGRGEQGNSAVLVRDLTGGCYISQNRDSYWISGCYLGLNLVIFKNHSEGIRLTLMLAKRANDDTVCEYLTKLVLKHAGVVRLRAAIDTAIQNAFDEGSEHRAELLRSALGL